MNCRSFALPLIRAELVVSFVSEHSLPEVSVEKRRTSVCDFRDA